MDESIQQVPVVVTSVATSNGAEDQQQQREQRPLKQEQQLLSKQQVELGSTTTVAATSAATSREAGDKLEPQRRTTMSLADMVDSIDDVKSQDQPRQQQEQGQQQEQQGTISEQARQGQHLLADSRPPNGSATDPAMLNQQTDPHEPAIKNPTIEGEGSGAGSNNSTLNRPKPPATQSATKLNGLKNRQRPPPLVLDKVSNFYDNVTNSSNVQPHQQQQQQQQHPQPSSIVEPQPISVTNENHKSNYSTQQNAKEYHTKHPAGPVTASISHQTDETLVHGYEQHHRSTNNNNNNNNNNNANQKFWASLNENASRTKALTNARSISATIAPSVTSSSQHRVHYDPGPNLLGPDLVIKQRNSTGSISSSRVVSTLSARKQQQQRYNQKNVYHSIDDTLKAQDGHNFDEQPPSQRADQFNHSDDLEDCLVTGDNNAGGNLIGVENNITPPVTDSRNHPHEHQQPQERHSPPNDEPPPSATSSRPRSNNPFLDDNDDDFEEYRNSIRSQSANRDSFSSQDNNFQKRPASFIAATERVTAGYAKPSSDFAAKQRIVEEKLSELQVNEQQSIRPQLSNGNGAPGEPTNMTQQAHLHTTLSTTAARPLSPDQLDSRALYQPVQEHQQQHLMAHLAPTNGSIYGITRNLFHPGLPVEPKINIDSESTVCQPPPSATMQLAHWSDAIYELNNAILETSSIAGGAENGQFIHIVESGDIILELDQIKVSGFTLVEFNQLADSKQFHLLKAVQTKHSHGLVLNLKDYLALSFPKNSKDKKLQSVIRDNIYRQTIPCTTRPAKSGEVDKVDYHFLTREQFTELNKQGALIECGVYVGHYYGTLRPLCDIEQILSNLSQVPRHESYQVKMRRAWDASHPAVEMIMKKDANLAQSANAEEEHPLYENHESLGLQPRAQLQPRDDLYMTQTSMPILVDSAGRPAPPGNNLTALPTLYETDAGMARMQMEPLPPGWERVMDQTHGTYYIDHNTKRTQYEQPYEVELTKSSMGFGFTLVEADSGLLLVRSVIPGGPAYMSGLIRPGDILVSAVGVSVTGLQHTDIARLFSTFAVGDPVRLTFARSNYVLDENLVPDEYLFSNGTNGDLAIAVNPNNYQLNQQDMAQNPHILVSQEFEFIKVTLKRGDQGFGFTISDSIAGQKVRKIQNHEICSNLKQGDILINLNGEDITKMTHKEVVERLKKCPPGDDVTLTIKRKKRFRSKTPMAMHTDASGEFSLDSTPQRNCKTPSLDGLMLRHPANSNSNEQSVASRNLFQPLIQRQQQQQQQQQQQHQQQHQQQLVHEASDVANLNVAIGLPPTGSYELHKVSGSLSSHTGGPQPLHGENMFVNQQTDPPIGLGQNSHSQAHLFQPMSVQPSTSDQPINDLMVAPTNLRPNSNHSSEIINVCRENAGSNSMQTSEASVTTQRPATYQPFMHSNAYNQSVNQYNNFVNNDKLVMMQMQQSKFQQPQIYSSSDYHQVPLYSNSEVINNEFTPQQDQQLQLGAPLALPIKPPMGQYWQVGGGVGSEPLTVGDEMNFHNNFYANNDEIAMQGMQYGYPPPAAFQQMAPADQFTFIRPISHGTPHDEHDEFEYHNVDLERENTDSNWGIRLIGGAEVDRAISIGSMIFGGVAAKSAKLKSGDEIISIDGVNVVGATHKHVVDLISACTNRVSLVVRRKTFAEACDVVLTKNLDEGFGFVIISNENCALIGKIIEGSPADRCKQLRVRDCIIAVNGRYITPDMKHPEIVNMIKDCGSTLRLRIIPVDCYTVKLIKDVQNDSFGFRMRGGSEYDGTPLYIVRVEPNGQAQGLLNVGDQILEINNIPTVGMTHQQAATIIKYSDPIVKLKLRRNYVTPPSLMVDSPRSLQKYNQTAEMKQVTLASTPTQAPSSHDTSFTSLPSNVNLMNQKFQQPLQMPSYQGMQADRSQPIYDRHQMTYVDQGTLYAT